ncbi:hypothetical protein O181_020275 [Austropuccinia psidii MF-1]|uniref:Uncharacterized protein n=1 Tax=Austropuccinia psidii MF-1 TaxID=1389203 RepID=A0A9Q3CC95_9BASI|nr:hypothetical protein [Austropuccinia psidii MF-1]
MKIISVQHSPPSRQRSSQARTQASFTLTPRAPLDGSLAVSQLRAYLDRGPNLGKDGAEEDENYLEEEGSKDTEVVPATVGESESTGWLTLPQSGKLVSHQSEQYLLAIMQKLSQIMSNLQEASSYEA